MTIKVQSNQSMLDVIIMACGSIEGGMAFCALNGVAISDTPAVDTLYLVPAFDGSAAGLLVGDSSLPDAGVLQYLGQNGVVIGTLGTAPEASGYVDEDGVTGYVDEDGAGYVDEH